MKTIHIRYLIMSVLTFMMIACGGGGGTSSSGNTTPLDNNNTQLDTDKDGIPDSLDTDDDNDGVLDTQDAFPLDSNENTDTDGDGLGDNADKPIISILSPTDDASNVSGLSDLSVTYEKFDSNLHKVAGKTFNVYKADGTEHTNFDVSSLQVSINGHTVTVNPNSHLVYGAGHYVQIDTGAFADDGGEKNPCINNSSRWNFSVPTSSGPCACDEFDNCDLPADLQ